LQLDYVDLYLVHIPAHFKKDGLVKEIESRDVPPTEEEVWQIKRSIMMKPRSGDMIAFHKEKWEGMERCVELGLAKAIGVSNFSVERIEEMLPYAKIIPAVNQVCFFPSSSVYISGHMLGNVSLRDILRRRSSIPNMFSEETCHREYVSSGDNLHACTSWGGPLYSNLSLFMGTIVACSHETIVLNVGGRAWKMQVEMHPLWQQSKLRAYCKEKGILLSAYSPLGAAGNAHGTNDVITNPTISEIAVKYGKTPAQVRLFPNLPKLEDVLANMNRICTSYVHLMSSIFILYIYWPSSSRVAFLIRKLFVCACVQVILQWVLGKGVSCIVRSYNRGRQLENFESQGWKLVDADIQTIDGLSNQKRYLDPDSFIDPVHGPFKTKKELWGEE
jgi:diketogulonate reductase-like aldo/keto reductase